MTLISVEISLFWIISSSSSPSPFFINSAAGYVHRFCSSETVTDITKNINFRCIFPPDDYRADICKACIDGDGCNGASQFGPITVMIAIPMAIIKFLSF